TGNGKSSLANVITRTDEFREGRYSISKTKRIQTEEFEYQGVKYQVIDTIGISDTREGTEMSLKKVLYNLAKVGYVVKDGLSQILLVTDGTDKSWKQEISLYNLLKETIFDEKIAQYTTIVKTRFANFEDEEECEKDRQILSKVGGEVGEFINELIDKRGNKIVYVDNPPVDIPGEGKRVEQQKKLNIETREISREVLLEKLVAYENVYKPENLDKLNKIIVKE
ncbi:7723_t:CDS:1, partial [Paraglomus occultum]